MLCSLCSKFCNRVRQGHRESRHHSSYNALKSSATEGCELCDLFRTVVLDYYANEASWPIEKVERYHLSIDNMDIKTKESRKSSFFATICSVAVDRRFVPLDEGIRGILFTRQTGINGIALREVFPFVEVCSSSAVLWNLGPAIIGREVSPNTDVSLSREWIDQCLDFHEACGKGTSPSFPPRVIEVGSSDGIQEPRLIIGKNLSAPYAALSHCWGGTIPAATTESNYVERLNSIPFSSLPKTFQHAIVVTRELGLRYLWIDSLCIIQHNETDWKEHCLIMGDIYKNSAVTLAAPAAANSNVGFLDPKAAPFKRKFTIFHGEESYNILLLHQIQEDPFLPESEQNSPLAERGWVVQESLLAPRTLYFGSKRIYFECCTNIWHENLHFPYVGDYQALDRVQKHELRSLTDVTSALQFWVHLVHTYMETRLTYETDRLPALSGLAREIHSSIKSKYLAGIWECDVMRELSWYIPYYSWANNGQRFQTTNGGYIAPSWSWASAKSGVSSCIPNYAFVFHDVAKAINATVNLADLDEFGRVSDGLLKIRGRSMTFEIHELLDDKIAKKRLQLYLRSPQCGETILGQFEPDEPPKTKRKLGSKIHYASSLSSPFSKPIQFLYLGYWGDSNGASREWSALAIQPIMDRENRYRRIGLAHGGSRFNGAKELLEHAQMITVEIV